MLDIDDALVPPHVIWGIGFIIITCFIYWIYALSNFTAEHARGYFNLSPISAVFILTLVVLGSQVGLGEALPLSDRLGIVVFAFIEQVMFFSPALFISGLKKQMSVSIWLMVIFVLFHRIEFGFIVSVILLLPGWAHATFCKNIWLSVGLHSAINFSIFSLSAFPSSDYVVLPFMLYLVGMIYALFDIYRNRRNSRKT